MGMAHLAKAVGFHRGQNWLQTLRYSEIAANKLKQLKDRRLETVKIINDAILLKFDSFQRLGRHREAQECAEERYTLWAMNHLRHSGSMAAALGLIESCVHNGKFEDAERYARHAYFMIVEMTDNFIPSDQQPQFLAEISYYLAQAILGLATSGGIPPEGKQKAGEEAIEHARKGLELRTQVCGTHSAKVAGAMAILAAILDYFNDVDNDEILRLLEQAIAIYRQVEGSLSMNLAGCHNNLGKVHLCRAKRAQSANDEDRELRNLQMALPNLLEAARIARANNHLDKAEQATQQAARIENNIRVGIAKAAGAGAAAAATKG